MNGIGDFVTSIKESRRLVTQVTIELKGDAPGHPFRGNQWEGSGVSNGDTSGGKGVTITTGATYEGVKKYEPSEETKQRITKEYDRATDNFKDRLGISRGAEFIANPDTVGHVEKFATKLNIQEIPPGGDDRIIGGRHIGNRTTFADQIVDGKSRFENQFEKDKKSIAEGKKPFYSTGSMSGLLSHELSHGVEDGFGFSQKAEWSEAYKKAKADGKLPSRYAEHNEHEGFAEVLSRHVETGHTDDLTNTAIKLTKQVFHNR